MGSFIWTGVSVNTCISFVTFRTIKSKFPRATRRITSGLIGVIAVTVSIMHALFVHALEFLVRFFKLCDLHGQLHITSVMLAWHVSFLWVALPLFPAKAFFGVPSFSYLRQVPVLWVF